MRLGEVNEALVGESGTSVRVCLLCLRGLGLGVASDSCEGGRETEEGPDTEMGCARLRLVADGGRYTLLSCDNNEKFQNPLMVSSGLPLAVG